MNNEKLDRILSTFTEQKQENAQLRNCLEELSNQVAILQDQVSSDRSSSGMGKFRVPPALSVSCCPVVFFVDALLYHILKDLYITGKSEKFT